MEENEKEEIEKYCDYESNIKYDKYRKNLKWKNI